MRPSPLVRTVRLALVVAALAAPATPMRAQVRLVDEGTFSLFLGGMRIGREDFSIRAAPGTGGSAYVAQANVLLGDSRLTVSLNADTAGLPLRYQLTVRSAGELTETIAGEARRNLWLGRALRPSGESAREFRLPPGTIAVEEGVVHHLWFVLRGGPGRVVPLLAPRPLALTTVRVEDAGPDRVSLGLREFVTRRWLVRDHSTSTVRFEVWTDLEGRLFRLWIPAQDLEALRDEPPRETPAGGGAYTTP